MTREQVIKGLEVHLKGNSRCEGCPYLNNGLCGDKLMADALALLKEQEASPWISVKDRLPDYESDYLVTDGHKTPWKCRLMSLAGVKGWVNDALNPTVKYWMPLPEPPKEEE